MCLVEFEISVKFAWYVIGIVITLLCVHLIDNHTSFGGGC